ncbi:ATP synthase subunit beta [Striga asiatica]|uniref:ATP synthase subunit beta n=1 Tax=Striga asiatica TaxID=4170 RepID=A0A5A7Q7N0_STRAF|nr:ATP synthase subunit beta [Striga asiatica]
MVLIMELINNIAKAHGGVSVFGGVHFLKDPGFRTLVACPFFSSFRRRLADEDNYSAAALGRLRAATTMGFRVVAIRGCERRRQMATGERRRLPVLTSYSVFLPFVVGVQTEKF